MKANAEDVALRFPLFHSFYGCTDSQDSLQHTTDREVAVCESIYENADLNKSRGHLESPPDVLHVSGCYGSLAEITAGQL
jgi:hypothetical protein